MISPTENIEKLMTRGRTAEQINRSMARLPMILEILGGLEKAPVPFAGDQDIRHGCERALTSMLIELARIEPAPSGEVSISEEWIIRFIGQEDTVRLVDPAQLERLSQFVARILGRPCPQ